MDPQDWRRLLAVVYDLHAAADHAGFSERVVAGMSRLILADVVVFQVLDRKRARLVTQMLPPAPFTEEEVAYYAAHSEEHPLAAYYTQNPGAGARRISDVIAETEWLASTYYRTCLQRLGLVHHLVAPVAIDASNVVALSFSRCARDFTAEDCELLDAFVPHLRLAWERHGNPWVERREWDGRQRLQRLGLSPRESEVLFWMTEGKVNREIAELLGLSLSTVQDHVARILAKLKLENRHAATVFAIARLRQP